MRLVPLTPDYPLTGSGEESEVGSVEESSGEEEEDSSWPETMVIVSASGDSIPTSLPCDSSFSLKAAMKGALYPNFDFTVNGKIPASVLWEFFLKDVYRNTGCGKGKHYSRIYHGNDKIVV